MANMKDVRFVSKDELLSERKCVFASNKTCCQICNMGPCQFMVSSTLSEGVCGADVNTVVARNLCRMIASGVSTHNIYAIDRLLSFKSELEHGHIEIDPEAFKRAWKIFKREPEESGKTDDLEGIALSWCKETIRLFGQQNGDCILWPNLPKKRKEIWSKLGWIPRGTNREVVEAMHRTHIGVDQEYHSILAHSSRCALSDLLCSSVVTAILTDIQNTTHDINEVNVDVHLLKETCINILFYGCDKGVVRKVRERLKDIGRYDLNFLEIEGREKAESLHIVKMFTYLVTGALDVLIVGDQEHFKLFSYESSCFHTKIFDVNDLRLDDTFLKSIILAYKSRNMRIFIPSSPVLLPTKAFYSLLTGLKSDRSESIGMKLSQAIANNNLKGIISLVGCIDRMDPFIYKKIAEEAVARDILVISVGCASFLLANTGMFRIVDNLPLGSNMKKFYESTGIYPIINMGLCSEVVRLLALFSEMLSDESDFTQLPVVIFMPSWRSEKIISVGHSLVSSGITTILSDSFPIGIETKTTEYMTDELKNIIGASWVHYQDNDVSKLIDSISQYLLRVNI